jgi:hypothetical protein
VLPEALVVAKMFKFKGISLPSVAHKTLLQCSDEHAAGPYSEPVVFSAQNEAYLTATEGSSTPEIKSTECLANQSLGSECVEPYLLAPIRLNCTHKRLRL